MESVKLRKKAVSDMLDKLQLEFKPRKQTSISPSSPIEVITGMLSPTHGITTNGKSDDHFKSPIHRLDAVAQVAVLIGVIVTTMSNSGTYLVTPVTSQHSSPTPVAHSYSGHSRADMPPLSTTLGLSSVRSLPHLAIYPALT